MRAKRRRPDKYLGNYRIGMTTTSLDNPSVIPDARSRDPGSRRRHARASGQPLALYFIHNDHLGTPRKVTDAEQRIVWSMEQTPFGEVTLTTEVMRMPMRFPGQYADIESGISYNYFRDFIPGLGRYIQSDPIGLHSYSFSTFVYIGSNPTSQIDRFALVGNLITGLVGGVTGAVVGGALNLSFQLATDGSFQPIGFLFSIVAGGVGGGCLGATGHPGCTTLGIAINEFGVVAQVALDNFLEDGKLDLYLDIPGLDENQTPSDVEIEFREGTDCETGLN